MGYDDNPLTKTYLSVDLDSVAGKFTSTTRQISSGVNAAEVAQDLASVALASPDGKTTNNYGPTQPATARLDDTWFRDSGERIEIWVFQVTDTGAPGRVAVATDLNHAQVTAQLGRRPRRRRVRQDGCRRSNQRYRSGERTDGIGGDRDRSGKLGSAGCGGEGRRGRTSRHRRL